MHTDTDTDTLVFHESPPEGAAAEEPSAAAPPWPLLVVDDDRFVHDVTKIVLAKSLFDGRPLEFLHAYSGEEARRVLDQRPDVAVILLDVVMEHEHAGLEVVRNIREERRNRAVRIILRTGQAGQAPEQEVFAKYDINDYKTKSELTAQRLSTTILASLRTYEHIHTIERNRQGLVKIVEGTSGLFRRQQLDTFASGVMEQMQSLLSLCGVSMSSRRQPPGAAFGVGDGACPKGFNILAGTGRFSSQVGKSLDSALPPEALEAVTEALGRRTMLFADAIGVCHAVSPGGNEIAIVVEAKRELSPEDRRIVELFCQNVAIAYDNMEGFQRLTDEIASLRRQAADAKVV